MGFVGVRMKIDLLDSGLAFFFFSFFFFEKTVEKRLAVSGQAFHDAVGNSLLPLIDVTM